MRTPWHLLQKQRRRAEFCEKPVSNSELVTPETLLLVIERQIPVHRMYSRRLCAFARLAVATKT
jgi:hypothetical protein